MLPFLIFQKSALAGRHSPSDMGSTRVKICGLTREEDIKSASGFGADAIGLVFYPPSPRYVATEKAAKLAECVPAFVCRVGLFVNAPSENVHQILSMVPLDLLQFHGDEDAAYCGQFGRPWIKVARVRPGLDLLEYERLYKSAKGFAGLLLDAYVENFGGAGQSFDWSLIPPGLSVPVILSGGLHAGNVSEAIKSIHPWAVDVSSGVEVDGGPKGIKDARRIKEFIAGVRIADADSSV